MGGAANPCDWQSHNPRVEIPRPDADRIAGTLREGYREAQRQIESYWTAGVVGAAVVQLTDADVPDGAERYRRECLEPLGLAVDVDEPSGLPIHARLVARPTRSERVPVDHYLLRLPRR